jgi:HlyD family secretion protein
MAKNGKKTRKKIIIFSALGLVVVALGVIVFLGSKKEPVILVQVEKAQRRTVTQVVTATGKIQPEVLVKITPEVSGEIVALPVKEGQKVKKGDVLMKIKPDLYVAQREQFAAALLQSKANLSRTEPEFKRVESLFKKNMVSETEFEQARAAYEQSKAAYAQSKASLNQSEDHGVCPDGRNREPVEFRTGRAGSRDRAVPGDRRHDDSRSLAHGSACRCQRE